MSDPTPISPPGTTTVYRAVLDALAQHGPRRAGVTHIARLAGTNRPYLYRNWSSPQALLQEATLAELNRVLHVARDILPDPLPPARCLAVYRVVLAARMLREHPVVVAMGRSAPDLTHAAVLRPAGAWHDTAWSWLCDHVTVHLPRHSAAQQATTLAVLTTALPYALTPPPADPARPEPEPAAERAAIDRRLRLALHPCLGLPLDCTDCSDYPPAA